MKPVLVLADCVGPAEENIAAGASLLRAATFCISGGVPAVERAIGSTLAAAAGRAVVAASFGPAELHRDYFEVARKAGATLIVAETMTSLSGALLAAGLAADVGLPALVSFSLRADGSLLSGEALVSAVAEVLSCPAVAGVGLNCGTAPDSFAASVPALSAVVSRYESKWLYLSPAAGLPDETGYYSCRPEDYAAAVVAMTASAAEAGAGRIIAGGCCGTTPAHLRAVAERLCDVCDIRNFGDV